MLFVGESKYEALEFWCPRAGVAAVVVMFMLSIPTVGSIYAIVVIAEFAVVSHPRDATGLVIGQSQ